MSAVDAPPPLPTRTVREQEAGLADQIGDEDGRTGRTRVTRWRPGRRGLGRSGGPSRTPRSLPYLMLVPALLVLLGVLGYPVAYL
ncbi:MAG TPA: hypothetical protein VHO00_04695, partial [Actinomycetes bacterium]|nr:hypothetical protein [Actinomycetes bacterium]